MAELKVTWFRVPWYPMWGRKIWLTWSPWRPQMLDLASSWFWAQQCLAPGQTETWGHRGTSSGPPFWSFRSYFGCILCGLVEDPWLQLADLSENISPCKNLWKIACLGDHLKNVQPISEICASCRGNTALVPTSWNNRTHSTWCPEKKIMMTYSRPSSK